MTDLNQLYSDLLAAPHSDIRLNVRIEMAFFKPGDFIVDMYPAQCGTRVTRKYRDSAGKKSSGTTEPASYTYRTDDALRLLQQKYPHSNVEIEVNLGSTSANLRGIYRVKIVTDQGRVGKAMCVSMPLALSAAMIDLLRQQ